MPNEYEEETVDTEEETVETESKPQETLEQREARLSRQLEQTRKKLGKDVEKAPQKESNEPDYAKLGYLNSVQVTHPDDQRAVIDEANRLKLPLTDVLQMEHMKARLQANDNQRTAENGSPSGSGRKGGAGKGDVDYYLANPDQVPTDLKLHNEVIDARIKRETDNNMFSSVPFIG
jgi:hypothetical protein